MFNSRPLTSLFLLLRSNTKLSLSTTSNGSHGAGIGDGTSAGRNNASFSNRFRSGETSSHGKSNPFNSITTPGGGLASPSATSASNAFGLGSGAFASFGSARTPKTPGNPFDLAMGGATSKTTEKPAATAPATKTIAKPSSMASISETASTEQQAPKYTVAPINPLRYKWVFWSRPPAAKSVDYTKTLTEMAFCETIEDFRDIYLHLKHPSDLPIGWDYHFFKDGITPIWEDPANKPGGKWVVRLRKGVADRYWESLLIGLIGDREFGDASEDVCGAVISMRSGEDILSLWTRTKGADVLKIR
jgi:translation initiation factor 4E